MKVKIVKEVKRSEGLWRFACGDVYLSIWSWSSSFYSSNIIACPIENTLCFYPNSIFMDNPVNSVWKYPGLIMSQLSPLKHANIFSQMCQSIRVHADCDGENQFTKKAPSCPIMFSLSASTDLKLFISILYPCQSLKIVLISMENLMEGKEIWRSLIV